MPKFRGVTEIGSTVERGEEVKVTILGATQQGNFVALRSGAVVLKAR